MTELVSARRPGGRALVKGLISGFAASLAVALVVALKEATGWLGGADLIAVFAELAGGFGLPETRWTGWAAHFFTGTILWGLLFGFLGPRFEGDPALKGILLGVVIWVGTIFIIFPLLGAGFAGMATGQTTPAVMLFMHLVYGSVLGGSYDLLNWLERRGARPA